MDRQFSMLESLTPTSFNGLAWRFARPKYATTEDFISGMGSFRSGARFNAPNSFPATYLSLSEETALAEMKHGLKPYGIIPLTNRTRVLAAVQVKLSRVVDLCDSNVRKRLGLTLDDLYCDWLRAQNSGLESITQQLGREVHGASFEALITPSVRHTRGRNLVVFPDRLLSSSELTTSDLSGFG